MFFTLTSLNYADGVVNILKNLRKEREAFLVFKNRFGVNTEGVLGLED